MGFPASEKKEQIGGAGLLRCTLDGCSFFLTTTVVKKLDVNTFILKEKKKVIATHFKLIQHVSVRVCNQITLLAQQH